MKMNNKEILITLIVVGSLLMTVYTYSAKGVAIGGEVNGYMIFYDHDVTLEDQPMFHYKRFSTTIYLPSENCEGIVTYCSYVWKEDVNTKIDISSNGKVDIEDVSIFQKAYGCKQGDDCWSKPLEDCFFTINDRTFKDPTQDCKMDQADADLVTKYFGGKTTPNSGICGTSDSADDQKCRTDINKDGRIDILDAVIVSSKFNQKYADVIKRYAEKGSAADFNNDNKVDILDAIILANNYDKELIEQSCTSSSLTQIYGKRYGVSAAGNGLYYAGVSYKCAV